MLPDPGVRLRRSGACEAREDDNVGFHGEDDIKGSDYFGLLGASPPTDMDLLIAENAALRRRVTTLIGERKVKC